MEEYTIMGSRERISEEAGDVSKGETPIKSFTEKVTPNIYRVVIKASDWKKDLTTYKCERELIGIRESANVNLYPNDDIIKQFTDDQDYADYILEEIYEEGTLKVKTEMHKIICKWIGPKPKIDISFDLEELPFDDVPASKFGII